MEILISIAIVAISMACLAIGVLLGGEAPKGSCGGLGSLGLAGSCDSCSERNSCRLH